MNISATADWIISKFETWAYGTKPNVMETQNEDELSWKTTSYGKGPQNLKIGISQQQLKMTSHGG
jgi:hypothetical protein